MEKLFRSQVMDEKNHKWMGKVTLQRPFPMKIAALSAIAFLAVLVYMLFFPVVSRSVTVDGRLAANPGLVTISAPHYGYVTFHNASVGQKIHKGQVLFELSLGKTFRNLDMAAQAETSLRQRRLAIIELATAQEHQLKNSFAAYPEREASIKNEMNKLAEEIELLKTKQEDNADLMRKYEILNATGYVSALQMTQIRNDRAEQLLQIKSLQRAELATQRELLKVQGEKDSISDQLAISKAQTQETLEELNLLALEQTAKISSQIVAPIAGVVTSKTIQPGQSVEAGTALTTMMPIGSKIVGRLHIPSRSIGHVKVGDSVKLRLAAYPFQKFGYLRGRLIMIERTPLGTDEMAQINGSDSFYRADVEIDSAFPFMKNLRPGMILRADITQGRRTLAYWLFAPLFAAAESI